MKRSTEIVGHPPLSRRVGSAQTIVGLGLYQTDVGKSSQVLLASGRQFTLLAVATLRVVKSMGSSRGLPRWFASPLQHR